MFERSQFSQMPSMIHPNASSAQDDRNSLTSSQNLAPQFTSQHESVYNPILSERTQKENLEGGNSTNARSSIDLEEINLKIQRMNSIAKLAENKSSAYFTCPSQSEIQQCATTNGGLSSAVYGDIHYDRKSDLVETGSPNFLAQQSYINNYPQHMHRREDEDHYKGTNLAFTNSVQNNSNQISMSYSDTYGAHQHEFNQVYHSLRNKNANENNEQVDSDSQSPRSTLGMDDDQSDSQTEQLETTNNSIPLPKTLQPVISPNKPNNTRNETQFESIITFNKPDNSNQGCGAGGMSQNHISSIKEEGSFNQFQQYKPPPVQLPQLPPLPQVLPTSYRSDSHPNVTSPGSVAPHFNMNSFQGSFGPGQTTESTAISQAMKMLQQKVHDLTQENQGYRDYISDISENFKKLEQVAIDEGREKEMIIQEFENYRQKEAELLQQMNKDSKRAQKTKDQLKNQQTEFSKVKADKEQLESKIQKLRDDNQRDRKRFEQEIKSMKEVLKQSNRGTKDVDQQLKRVLEEKQNLELKIKKLKQKNRNMKEDFTYKKERVEMEAKDAHNQLNIVQNQVFELRNNQKDQLNNMRNEIDQLQKILTDERQAFDKQLYEKSEAIEALKEELLQVRKENLIIKEEEQRVRSHCLQIMEQNREAQTKKDKAEEQIQKVQEVNDILYKSLQKSNPLTENASTSLLTQQNIQQIGIGVNSSRISTHSNNSFLHPSPHNGNNASGYNHFLTNQSLTIPTQNIVPERSPQGCNMYRVSGMYESQDSMSSLASNAMVKVLQNPTVIISDNASNRDNGSTTISGDRPTKQVIPLNQPIRQRNKKKRKEAVNKVSKSSRSLARAGSNYSQQQHYQQQPMSTRVKPLSALSSNSITRNHEIAPASVQSSAQNGSSSKANSMLKDFLRQLNPVSLNRSSSYSDFNKENATPQSAANEFISIGKQSPSGFVIGSGAINDDEELKRFAEMIREKTDRLEQIKQESNLLTVNQNIVNSS